MQLKASYYRSGIYLIRHDPSGRVYVGQASCIAKRWSVHLATLRMNKHHCTYLQRAWNKYGEGEFTFKVIQFCELSELNEAECKWVGRFKQVFNIHPPGGVILGFKHREEVKARMRVSAKRASNTPEQRRMRSERAYRQHAEGNLTPRELVDPVRACSQCGKSFNRYKLHRGGYYSGRKCLYCTAETYRSQGGRFHLDNFDVSQDDWDMAAYLITPLRTYERHCKNCKEVEAYDPVPCLHCRQIVEARMERSCNRKRRKFTFQ